MNRGQIIRIRAAGGAASFLLGSGWNFSCLLVRQQLAHHFTLGFSRMRIGKFLFEKSKVFGVDEPFRYHGLPPMFTNRAYKNNSRKARSGTP